jgi:UDP-N-acetylglucosamine 1-carboxyvinyltransferase
VEGGTRLAGSIRIGGAKNAVSKQILASLLTEEPCILGNVPRIGEIDALLAMLAELGTRHAWLDQQTLWMHTPSVRHGTASARHCRHNRLSPLLLSCLLHRLGAARVAQPGGCRLGARPIDFHVQALSAMGAAVTVDPREIRAVSRGLHGTTIHLPYPSVGATENVLLLAVRAEGMTVLENAAIEPEVLDSVAFLRKMGAAITLEGERTLIVEGVGRLFGARHCVLADRIEAASFAIAAAATDGEIRLSGVGPGALEGFLPVFSQAGGGWQADGDGVTCFRRAARAGTVQVESGPFPGFSTDWLVPMMVLLTQGSEPCAVHESVFENRLGLVHGLRRMGAGVRLSTGCLGSQVCRFHGQGYWHSAVVHPRPLHAAKLKIPDLRAGFAYLTAALIADGVTELAGVHHLHRGYGNLLGKLRQLGARIEMR